MTAFSEPTKWAQALGATANADVIPDEAGAMDVDISKIFPAAFSIPLAQGGKAIPRRTLNGIFKTLGEWAFFNQNGGVPSYDADFDYTVGRLVSYNGGLYKCIQDNVHTTPHNPTDKDYWAELSDSSSSTGLLPNQIITSPVPLSDANLHLLDGSLLTSGVYAEYVAMMIRLYNADPTASCWISEADWQTSVTTYGECGKFVVDTVNNTVRLPKLTSFIQATSTASELGSLTEAGLPNITGYIEGIVSSKGDPGGVSGPFTRNVGSAQIWNQGVSGFYNTIKFSARNSNSIYGNSNTVQPQSVKYYFYIVVGTVSKTPVQVDIDNIATDLNGKADRSLSNISLQGKENILKYFSNIGTSERIEVIHNGIFRGENLLDYFNSIDAIQTAVQNGDFSKIYIGDYVEQTITYSGTQYTTKYRVAGINTFKNYGDTALTRNHLVLIPDRLFDAQMNTSNTTSGGYVGSRMYTTVLPALLNALAGSSSTPFYGKIISHRELFANAENNWAWYDNSLCLLSEMEAYGSRIFANYGFSIGFYAQMPLFKLNPDYTSKFNRHIGLLRSVNNSDLFCTADHSGDAGIHNASEFYSVRPRFLFG